jgi:hypothetical protein
MQFRWRTPQMEASLAVRENTPHGRDQSIEFYRLAVNPAASAFSRSPASACAERAMTGMSRLDSPAKHIDLLPTGE